MIRKIFNKVISIYYKKYGYSTYYIDFYRKEMKKNYKNSGLPAKDKKWAYKRGFNPWRIVQYGLTEENYRDVISDRDYFYLYPINNRYSSWIDNKLTMKYILAPFDKYLPKYYFHLLHGRDVMKLMDCHEKYSADVDSVVSLLEDSGTLAAKMAAGTYGIGFYKLEFKNGSYVVNGEIYDKEKFKDFILSLNDYIITEYIEMHSDLKKINPYSVNTIRVVVINEYGNDTIIPFAFMRIGTKKSGIVDNVAQGGMVCKINVDTGEFYQGQVLKNHVYEDVEIHPDTKTKLNGIIPHWELVKTELIKISKYYPQLEWLGYDIAITEGGFSIIEINSHQGLHKAHEYPEVVKNYLNRKLITKKRKYSMRCGEENDCDRKSVYC